MNYVDCLSIADWCPQNFEIGFDAYKKNAAAGGVMGMIQQIINDAKAMEAEVLS